ncbi:MAG: hypothetical protein AB7I27_10190 [Bacteriovoracaceae bacterium]
MKLGLIGLITFFHSLSLMANPIDDAITNLREMSQSMDSAKKSGQIEFRDNQFWTKVIDAYNFMANNQIEERYVFLYKLSNVFKKSNIEERITDLKNWIQDEDKRISSAKLNYANYNLWKRHYQEISQAIQEIKQVKQLNLPELAFNETIQKLENLKNSPPRIVERQKIINKRSIIPVTIENENSNESLPYFLMAIASILAIAIPLFRKEKMKLKKEIKVIKETVILPQIPNEVEGDDKTQGQLLAIDLENKCSEVIQENKYLFEAAGIQIHPKAKSAFNTKISIPESEIESALTGIIKGTLALANCSTKKASHIDWGCKEQFGRVSLEFTIHGINCDTKSVYTHTLIEGDGSAPAHFARAEKSLNSNLGHIALMSNEYRTTISLGMDATSESNYTN